MTDILLCENDCSLSASIEELGSRDVRKVYLVTYSQADIHTFPTRKSFAQAVVASFSRRSAAILQWCCSQESHKKSGIHYHMCLKLDRNQRWLPSKKYLADHHDISVHFSSMHANYYTAWKYVTKEDVDAEESESHPDLGKTEGPPTMNAHIAKRQLRRKRSAQRHFVEENEDDKTLVDEDETALAEDVGGSGKAKQKKRKRLSAYEFFGTIVSKGLKNRMDVLAFANMQKNEGKTDLAEFIINRGTKVVNEVIATAWEMEMAKTTQERRDKSRMEILREAQQGKCKCLPTFQWHTCALELLANNAFSVETFSKSMTDLLTKGRGKYRNIMFTGPANCGKTFLLNPLNNIYNTFTNPASTSFAWVGADEAEIVFLNDFRWSPQIIAWHDLLLMLEGQLVHLPAPKSHFAKDTVFDKDTPILCTSKHQLVFVKNGAIDERETEMMSVRWKVFNFNRQIPQAEQKEVSPCPACFARLILH